ncbi:MAG: hypothetical protein ACOZB1_01805, partial [Pseudomonadota bacterium]
RKDAKAAKNDPQPHPLGVGHPSGLSFASFALLRVLCVKCGFQDKRRRRSRKRRLPAGDFFS